MRIYLSILLFSLNVFVVNAQQLSGMVYDGENNEPIAGASIFINNSSIGTTSDKQGKFRLDGLPSGSFLLVISSVGYGYEVQNHSAASQSPLVIRLKRKVDELDNVVVESYNTETWEKWGKLFEDYFIGLSANASMCKILNKDKIKFRYYKGSSKLVVYCDEPVLIENKALGYHVQYSLENFTVSFAQKMNTYSGYVFFEDFKKVTKKQLKNREEAYAGSKMHFFRSLYKGELENNGFELRKMVREMNIEKQRVTPLYRAYLQQQTKAGRMAVDNAVNDTIKYYQKITKEPDYKDHYLHPYTADSIRIRTQEGAQQLYFTDFVLVTYHKALEEPGYLAYYGESNRRPFAQRSLITLEPLAPITFFKDGSYENPESLISSAYWSWRDNTASLLPINYGLK